MECVAQVYRVHLQPEARLRFVILAEVVERTRHPALRSFGTDSLPTLVNPAAR